MPSASTELKPHDGKPFLKTMFSLANELEAVKRFSRLRMVHDENVLTHTGMVCVFAYIIASKLTGVRSKANGGIDVGTVLRRAVVHDWDETITGDIVRPTKYFSSALRAELGKLEAQGIYDIGNAFGMASIDADFIKSKDGREGYVVKLADFVGALHRVWVEVMVHHNMNMRQPAGPMVSVLEKLALAADKLHWSDEENMVINALIRQASNALGEVFTTSVPLGQLHEAK